MGMIGTYIAVDDKLLQDIINEEVDILDLDEDNSLMIDIDKSWQAIHYLLCEDIDEGDLPMGYVVPLLEDNLMDCDLDYGAYYLNNDQVGVALDYLNTLDDETLKELYDFNAMVIAEIYPIVDDEDQDEFYDYIYDYLQNIKMFYQEVVARKMGIIFYVM